MDKPIAETVMVKEMGGVAGQEPDGVGGEIVLETQGTAVGGSSKQMRVEREGREGVSDGGQELTTRGERMKCGSRSVDSRVRVDGGILGEKGGPSWRRF